MYVICCGEVFSLYFRCMLLFDFVYLDLTVFNYLHPLPSIYFFSLFSRFQVGKIGHARTHKNSYEYACMCQLAYIRR